MLLPYLVLVETATAGLRTIIFFSPLTHREVAERFLATHTPRSGGWCHLFPDHAAATRGSAGDLGLVPDRGDGVLLFAQYRATARAGAAALTSVALQREQHRAPAPLLPA